MYVNPRVCDYPDSAGHDSPTRVPRRLPDAASRLNPAAQYATNTFKKHKSLPFSLKKKQWIKKDQIYHRSKEI